MSIGIDSIVMAINCDVIIYNAYVIYIEIYVEKCVLFFSYSRNNNRNKLTVLS